MKTKIIFFMILIILFTIIISQNSGEIVVKILFWDFKASEIVVVAMTGFIGLILGFVLASIFSSIGKKQGVEKRPGEIHETKPKTDQEKFKNEKDFQ
jgi:uncharacterized integral membrane protein